MVSSFHQPWYKHHMYHFMVSWGDIPGLHWVLHQHSMPGQLCYSRSWTKWHTHAEFLKYARRLLIKSYPCQNTLRMGTLLEFGDSSLQTVTLTLSEGSTLAFHPEPCLIPGDKWDTMRKHQHPLGLESQGKQSPQPASTQCPLKESLPAFCKGSGQTWYRITPRALCRPHHQPAT